MLYAIEDLTRMVERESTETRLLLYAGAIRAKLDARGIWPPWGPLTGFSFVRGSSEGFDIACERAPTSFSSIMSRSTIA